MVKEFAWNDKNLMDQPRSNIKWIKNVWENKECLLDAAAWRLIW